VATHKDAQQQPADQEDEVDGRGAKRQRVQGSVQQPSDAEAAQSRDGSVAAAAAAEREARRSAHWAALLDALPLGKGSRADLQAVAAEAATAEAAGGAAIPGLHLWLYKAADALLARHEADESDEAGPQ
jgi:hypothetical protein